MSATLARHRRTFAVFLVLVCTGLCFADNSPLSRAQEEPAPRKRADSRAERHAEFRRKMEPLHKRCARCHDADGSGNSSRDDFREIPNFRSHSWQASRSDTALLVSILDGKGKHMPAHRGKISDSEARALVVAIRTLDPSPGVRPVADDALDDWERRFAELEKELDDLKRQFRELSHPKRKP